MAQSAARGARSSYRVPATIREAHPDDLSTRHLFNGIGRGQLEKLIGNARICWLPADKPLWPDKTPARHTYVITEGYVAIWATSTFAPSHQTFLAWRGKEDILFETLLAWRGGADVPAASQPSDSQQPTATIETCTRCEFLEIENSAFNKFTESCPLIYRNLARLLVKKMSFERLRSEVIEAPHADQRIARALLSLAAERCGSGISTASTFTIPGRMKQSDLAGYVGYSTAETNRNLVALRDENIIDYSGHSGITILDNAKLRKIANVRLKSARKPKA